MDTILHTPVLKCNFMNESECIFNESVKNVVAELEDSNYNKSSLVQVMAWRWTGNKLFPEPVLTKMPASVWHY